MEGALGILDEIHRFGPMDSLFYGTHCHPYASVRDDPCVPRIEGLRTRACGCLLGTPTYR